MASVSNGVPAPSSKSSRLRMRDSISPGTPEDVCGKGSFVLESDPNVFRERPLAIECGSTISPAIQSSPAVDRESFLAQQDYWIERQNALRWNPGSRQP